MFCPICRAEYRAGFETCSDCQVALVDELPPEVEQQYEDMIVILETANEVEILRAKTVLESAGIPFIARNDQLQDLFAAGRLGGFNPVIGPVQFLVAAERAQEAQRLITEMS